MPNPSPHVVLTIWLACVSTPATAASSSAGRDSLPASVKLIADISYAGTDNPRHRLDLMLPSERPDAPLPVVVFIHGGAWRGGDKRGAWKRIIPLVESGNYAAVSVAYRLSGEAKWPSQIHDCKAAVRWIRANAARHRLNPDRIGVWGSSAGGHLVAMLGTSGDVPGMDGALGENTHVSSRVTCVVDFFGPTNFLTMNRTAFAGATMDHDAPDSPESQLIGGPIHDNVDKVATANPITYVTADDPPFLIVHGTRDPLVSFNQSELLHAALQEANAASTLITVAGAGHGDGFGPGVDALVRQFFDHHLRGIEATWADQTIPASPRSSRG